MKKLIDICEKIYNILLLLDKVMHKEYINLLDSQTDIKKLSFIIEKKRDLLTKLTDAKKIRMSLEKKHNIFFPYLESTVEFTELNHYSNEITKKCIFLNKLNLKNKKLIKNKFYLNQNFLNFYKSYNYNVIYNIHGKLEN